MLTSQSRRVLLALAVSPAVLPAAVLVYALYDGARLKDAILVAAIYALFTYSLTLVLGLPAHALLQRWGFTSVFSYAAAGVIAGLLVLAAFFVTSEGVGTFDLPAVLLFAGMGAVTASVFWALAKPEAA